MAGGNPDSLEGAAVKVLVNALGDRKLEADPEHQEFGRTLAEALGRFAPVSSSAVQVVSKVLIDITNRRRHGGIDRGVENKLEDFQTALTGALSQMGAEAKLAIPPLKAMLESKNLRAQQAAAYALRNIGPMATKAKQDLITRISLGSLTVRMLTFGRWLRLRSDESDLKARMPEARTLIQTAARTASTAMVATTYPAIFNPFIPSPRKVTEKKRVALRCHSKYHCGPNRRAPNTRALISLVAGFQT